MAKEALYIPEEILAEVIAVIWTGLKNVQVSERARSILADWCIDEGEYLVTYMKEEFIVPLPEDVKAFLLKREQERKDRGK